MAKIGDIVEIEGSQFEICGTGEDIEKKPILCHLCHFFHQEECFCGRFGLVNKVCYFRKLQDNAPEALTEPQHTSFKDIADRLVALQARKNESYGNAFGQSCDKYGIVSALTRLNDKMNRLDSLYKSCIRGTGTAPSPQMTVSVFGESFTDTLTDLAAYAIMTIEYLEKHQKP